MYLPRNLGDVVENDIDNKQVFPRLISLRSTANLIFAKMAGMRQKFIYSLLQSERDRFEALSAIA